MPTRCNRLFLLQILLLAQHVSGTTMPIIRSSRVLYRWLLPVVFGALFFKLSVWCRAKGYMSGLWAAAPCSVRLSGTLHGTKYTHHSLKYLLPQHRKSYNDVFLLINLKKMVALARLSISSLRMVQVNRNV